jgi:hypothetical protein
MLQELGEIVIVVICFDSQCYLDYFFWECLVFLQDEFPEIAVSNEAIPVYVRFVEHLRVFTFCVQHLGL